MNFRIIGQAIIMSIFLFVWADCLAGTPPKDPSVFGIKFGYYGNGDIVIDNFDYNPDDDVWGGIYLDYPIHKKLYLGAAVDIIQFEYWDDKYYILDISLVTKFRIKTNDPDLFLHPAVGVGYAWAQDIPNYGESDYLTFQFFMEMLYKLTAKQGLVIDMGYLWGPNGGNDRHDITFGPMFIFRGGLAF
nr:hypothetical protein [candidate division Zixibacteria bacterium]